jgi:rod shape-determining protein MreC
LGEINYIPTDLTLQPGEALTVVTSGLGGVFPPGLVIGRVNALTSNPDGLFKTSTVLLDKRLSSISEVAVLIPITENIP